jgi:bifunctional non-homologous end joining protein LigD
LIFITSPQISEPPHMLEPALKAFEFCHPSQSAAVPSSPDWHYEIKYDGYRRRLERGSDRVRLITRGGYNWTDRYPWIVEAARKVRHRRFVLDGEAVGTRYAMSRVMEAG